MNLSIFKKGRSPSLLFVLLLIVSQPLIAQPTFFNKVGIPPLVDARDGTIELFMSDYSHSFNPGVAGDSLNNLESWGYNVVGDTTMTILGPTLKWYTNETVTISVQNSLPASTTTTTHWHGAEIPAEFDGGPHQIIQKDSTWNISFTNLDPNCTIWYHPHVHNATFQQVQFGLSGMIISEDPTDTIHTKLPRTYGVDDLPLVIGDLRVLFDSSNNTYAVDTAKGKRPTNIVNGVTNPYLEVPAHYVRLRLLNGSTRKGVQVSLSESYDEDNFIDFYHIATDGGFMLEPQFLHTLLFGPGAREEILLDLREYSPGDTLYLRNRNELMPGYIVGSPQGAPNGGGGDATQGKAFVQLRIIDDPAGYDPVDTFEVFSKDWPEELQNIDNGDRMRYK